MHRTLTEHQGEFQRALRGWFLSHRRPLPWRTTPSLYRTVVSEFMLQQTQVKTVLPFFDAWLERFPNFNALAKASEESVLKAWEGLGYYNRARNLHGLAKAVAAIPSPPATAAEWEELPGVGPYTAAAIASIACNDSAACVDGNVVRVLARLTATGAAFRDNAAAVKHFAPIARSLLNRRHPGEHNEAMMELGATVCTKAAPVCDRCPVSRFCAAVRTPDPSAFPRIARRATEHQSVTRIWCVSRGQLLLHRVSGTARRLAGQHELPEIGTAGVSAKTARNAPIVAKKTRSITHHRIVETIVRVGPKEISKSNPDGELVWIPIGGLDRVTLSGPHRRWVREILEAPSAPNY